VDVSSESIGVAGGSLLISPRLLDIAQVEIVKGPQSALFGRSAFAGAISYTTQDPSSEPTRSVSMDLSSEGQYEAKGGMSGPLSDTLGYRLGVYAFTDDGYYFNKVTQQSTGGGEGRGVALSLKWEPSDNYSAKFRSEFTNDKFDPSSQAALAFNSRRHQRRGRFGAGRLHHRCELRRQPDGCAGSGAHRFGRESICART
jgi:outer membrane receptor protein involved in Fe transport